MTKYNLDADDYYTQRNNRISPNAACMPTARVMYYRGNGITYNNPTMLSDDDYLMQTLNTKKAVEFAKAKYKWACNSENKLLYPSNEIHGMYNSYLDELVVGRRTGDFLLGLSAEECIDVLAAGYVIMTSGSFKAIPGHALCLIGFDSQNFHLADPWGDWRTGYRDVCGYGATMSKSDFVTHIKPTESVAKWAHLPYDAIEAMKKRKKK